jgi:farnesyl-diphosphate farnesyltransferase
LVQVSRTFALSIEALPDSLRPAVRVAYLLCRILDTIEDDAGVEPSARQHLFDGFAALVSYDVVEVEPFEVMSRRVELGSAREWEADLCCRSSIVFRVFRSLPRAQREAIRPHVLEMCRGMQRFSGRADDAGKLRLGDVEELEEYCYFVAGTVGQLLTELFELDVPTLSDVARERVRDRAVSFGVGLQMVNIVKDVADDWTRGDCYLPVDLAEREGVALDQLLEPASREAGLRVVRAICARAREHLQRAREYALAWPPEEGRNVRFFCAVPLGLALASLREVESGDDTLRAGRTPKISRQCVQRIFVDAQRAVANDAALEEMLDGCDGG